MGLKNEEEIQKRQCVFVCVLMRLPESIEKADWKTCLPHVSCKNALLCGSFCLFSMNESHYENVKLCGSVNLLANEKYIQTVKSCQSRCFKSTFPQLQSIHVCV